MEQQAGEVFAAFVTGQLDQEERRRASVESRGAGVITLSGTMVTLLFGISAVATKNAAFVVSAEVKGRLTYALIAFAISSIVAIGTTIPLLTGSADAAKLIPEFTKRWTGTVDDARQKVVGTLVEDLAAAQRLNSIRSTILLIAVVAQVVAVLLLAWAVSGLLT